MSWQMNAVAHYARLVRKPRTYGSVDAARKLLHRNKGDSQPPIGRASLRDHRISTTCYGEYTCYTVIPRLVSSPGSTVYVHGGGYVNEIATQHWDLVGDIATATARPVHVPIYGLAPDHHALQAHTLVRAVLADHAADGPVHLAGDSAGAGLALAVTQAQHAAGEPAPHGLTLISPWLDILLRNPAVSHVAARDPWLGPDALRYIGANWAGPLDPNDFRVSPLLGDLTVTPPLDLYVGDRDVLAPDCRALRDALPPDRITYHEQAGAIHVYPLLPVPEGRTARTELINRIANRLGQ